MKPSYLKIKKQIEDMIENKELAIGEKLPSEYEMANYFNVSRDTFRTAVKLLEQERKLLVKHGIGTFVIEPLSNIDSSLEKLQSMSNMIKIAGLKEGETKEAITNCKCNKEWAEALDIKEGTAMLMLERIRTANGEPVALTISLFPKDSEMGSILSEKGYLTGSLFTFLERDCNIHIIRADTQIIVPTKDDANILKLQINSDTPILLLKQIHYDERNRPIFYALDYLRNDIFKFWIRRERQE